jgi:Tol biopolymer transport system component
VAYLGEGPEQNGPTSVFVADASGGGVTRVTKPGYICGPVSWVNEGSLLAFPGVHRDAGAADYSLYLAEADGGDWALGASVKPVPGAVSAKGRIAASPDGMIIAYSSRDRATGEVVIRLVDVEEMVGDP